MNLRQHLYFYFLSYKIKKPLRIFGDGFFISFNIFLFKNKLRLIKNKFNPEVSASAFNAILFFYSLKRLLKTIYFF